MAETVHQETQQNPNAATPAATFTQAQLDAILTERLARERAKYQDYEDLKAKAAKFDAAEAAGKTELQKATEKAAELQKKLDEMTAANTRREIREKIARETGVPADLLSGDTEEACKAQAEKINAYARPTAYPAVPDAGELPQRAGGDDPITAALRKVNQNLAMQKN